MQISTNTFTLKKLTSINTSTVIIIMRESINIKITTCRDHLISNMVPKKNR